MYVGPYPTDLGELPADRGDRVPGGDGGAGGNGSPGGNGASGGNEASGEGDRWRHLFERQLSRSHLIERWLAALGVGPGSVLADIGAGSGLASLMAARRAAPHGRIYAVDVEPGALAFLADRLREEQERGGALAAVETVVADAATVQLPEPVDGLLITHVLHHVEDPIAVLRHCRRLLRPGGRAVVAEFDPNAPGAVGPPPDHRIARATLQSWLEQAGWRVEGLVSDQDEQYAWLVVPRE